MGLHAQVQELTLENEQLKREYSVGAVPGEEAAASPALQALREKTQAVLDELEAAKPSTAGTPASALRRAARHPEALHERLLPLDRAGG